MLGPWVDPIKFGILYGGLGGGLLGGVSGLLGGAAVIARRTGRGLGVIHKAFITMISVGVLHLAVGIYASISHQAFGITFPLLLIGAVLTVVFTALLPVLAQAKSRAQ